MLALIPLDNRPCNLRFPRQIAAIGGSDLLSPPEELLGYFTTPGQLQNLARWLDELPSVEALIVSSDMLAYGGLVASRRPSTPVDKALETLAALKKFRAARPQTPIYVFSILMRLAVTLESEEATANYFNIMRYARLADEAERFNSAHLRGELEKVQALIPPHVLADYLAARARNHSINAKLIEWLSEGVFDYLLITQEDAAEYGLHRQEQAVLLEKAASLGVSDKMSLHPGADEAALTLLARHWDSGVRFRVQWSSFADSGNIAPFEDRPYNQALREHIEAMRGVWADIGASDFDLFVNAPVGGYQKDESETERAGRAARLNNFVQQIEKAVADGKRVALCDVAFPNGADNLLLTELEQRRLLGKLAVFGAWNTAGNTTGTVLAQCSAILRGGPLKGHVQTAKLNRNFLFERLLDDWCYQTNVRTRIEKTAREHGVSPLNMGETGQPIEAQARREMRGSAQILSGRQFRRRVTRCDVTLPWQRTFECDVRAELSV